MAYYDQSHLKRLTTIRETKKHYQNVKMGARVPREILERKESDIQNPNDIASSENQKQEPEHTRKKEIIGAAINLFSQKGYQHTNVRDITQALGISKATFYLYFASKRELFMEVVDEVMRLIIDEVDNEVKNVEENLERNLLRAQVYNRNYFKYNEIINQLRAEMTSENDFAREKLKEVYMELTKPMIKALKEDIKNKLFRDVDPELFAYMTLGVADIMAVRMTLDDKYSFNEILEFVYDIGRNGLELEGNNAFGNIKK